MNKAGKIESRVVGQWIPATGAEDIVTGSARYCPDIDLPGMLTGKLLYSPHARARIKKLDVWLHLSPCSVT